MDMVLNGLCSVLYRSNTVHEIACLTAVSEACCPSPSPQSSICHSQTVACCAPTAGPGSDWEWGGGKGCQHYCIQGTTLNLQCLYTLNI